MYSLSLSLSLSLSKPKNQIPLTTGHPLIYHESLFLSFLFRSAFIFQCHQLFFNAQRLFETKTKSTCFYFSPLLLIENLFKGDYDTIQFNGYCSVALFI